MPFADLAPGATQDVPGLDEPRLDDLELFGEPIRGPLKNVVSVGQAVLPGQGLESGLLYGVYGSDDPRKSSNQPLAIWKEYLTGITRLRANSPIFLFSS